jgi:hypothetical protein
VAGLEPGVPLKYLRTTQDFVPEGSLNHFEAPFQDWHKI